MYREETESTSNFYEYVGMADVENFQQTIHSTECLDNIRDIALAFRKKSLDFMPNGYELQLLEQAVTILMPYCDFYHTTKEQDLFVSHYGLKGVHYFTRKWM
jgi:hypothetical protein